MTTTPRPTFRRWAGAVLAAASLVGVLASCSLASPTSGLDTPVPPTATPSTPVTPTQASMDSVRIVLRFGDESAAATLADTPAAREFAAMLPLELNLHDPMGQAKSGPLPRPIDVGDSQPVFDPAVGQIYYSASSSTFAIFHDDLGQSIPNPGLLRLGAVNAGMERIADAGNRFPVQIDFADHPAFDQPADRSLDLTTRQRKENLQCVLLSCMTLATAGSRTGRSRRSSPHPHRTGACEPDRRRVSHGGR